jgi:parvulin-like peptidyl-prolyl isomerase
MHRYLLVLSLMLWLIAGCGGDSKGLKESELERAAVMQKIELVEAAGGLVLMVGGDTLTSDEIINSQALLDGKVITPKEQFKPIAQAVDLETFKKRVKDQLEQIVMDHISNIVLYQYAKRQAGKNIDESLEQAAQNEYRRFVLGYEGDQAKADEALKKGGLDRKSYMERVKRDVLIRSYVTTKLPDDKAITHRELLECYEKMKDEYFARPARIRFRLIDIQPAKLTGIDPNQDPEQLAEELAGRLLARIEAGEDFEALAKDFSNGPMAAFGGLWRPVQPTSLRAPYDVIAAAAEKMQQGQIAGPIPTTGHVFIMKLEEKRAAGYEPFEAVQDQVREEVAGNRRNKALEPLRARLKWQAKLGRTDEFVDFCLEKIYRMSRPQK